MHDADAHYRAVMSRLIDARADLDRAEAARTVSAMLDLRFSDVEIAATLAALARKGETADEIAGAVDAINARSTPLPLPAQDALDIGGTGGDRAGTFNISTTAAFVAAGAGARVIKHGNRSVTSACGSADLIDALGADALHCSAPGRIAASLAACGFAFVSTASHHHFPPRIGELRRALGMRSLFNLAGPLVHPARIGRQVVGVARPEQQAPIAAALARLERDAAFVVHGVAGLDEVSCAGETLVTRVERGATASFSVTARDFGLSPCRVDDLRGGDPQTNAAICRAILDGERGPRADTVTAAAGMALVLDGRARTFADGAQLARHAIDSGAARKVLDNFLCGASNS
ncbi:anthranilate phosphoribosyltransferase [Burkholderia sp. F1]|uniref:anthranilate phosphoribosyltransferase n=1 Tax=Burkholderia sp. F1 TaxID=3366817 RepID=UPI003D7269C3